MTNKLVFIGVLLFLFAYSASSSAHDIWVKQCASRLCLYYGHDGKPETYSEKAVSSVNAIGIAGQAIAAKQFHGKHGLEFATKLPTAMFTVTYDNGYWLESEGKWKRVSGDPKCSSTKPATQALKTHKLLVSDSPLTKQATGLNFELVLLDNPFRLPQGKPLRIRVLLFGKPLAGVTVRYRLSKASPIVRISDATGTVTFPLTSSGEQFFSTSHTVEQEKKCPIAFATSLLFNRTRKQNR